MNRLLRCLLTGAALAAVAGCGAAGSSSPAQVALAPVRVPSDVSLVSGTTAWVDVAMGHLGQPLNTFWELFVRSGNGRWSLRTPQNVADNGGLTITAPDPARLVVGFRPSQGLTFSPLAVTGNDGRTYAPGLFPDGLDPVVDGLSVAPNGHSMAVARNRLLESDRPTAGWRPLLNTAAALRSSADRSCGARSAAAVAVTDRTDYLAANCPVRGTVGIFALAGRRLRFAGPRLPASFAGDWAQVIRLVSVDDRLAALLRLTGPTGRSDYVEASMGAAGWRLSTPTPATGSVLSTGLTAGGGFVVLSGSPSRPEAAAVISPGSGGWRTLPAPPADTAVIVVSKSSVDAVVLGSVTFTDDRLTATGRWSPVQTIRVPVPFGSSS